MHVTLNQSHMPFSSPSGPASAKTERSKHKLIISARPEDLCATAARHNINALLTEGSFQYFWKALGPSLSISSKIFLNSGSFCGRDGAHGQVRHLKLTDNGKYLARE